MRKGKITTMVLMVAVFCTILAGCGPKDPGTTYTKDTKKATTTTTGDNVPPMKEDDFEQKSDNTITSKYKPGDQLKKPGNNDEVAVIHTSKGDITIRFFNKAAPKAVENFKKHAKNGYYDGVIFHRVMEDFMIQGGDPEGTGFGGESIWGKNKPFEDEFDTGLSNIRGSVAMANSGPATNGSQFFINQARPTGQTGAELKKESADRLEEFLGQVWQLYAQNPEEQQNINFRSFAKQYLELYNLLLMPELVPDKTWDMYAENGGNVTLDGAFRMEGGHTVFAQVIDGMDVVDKIAEIDTYTAEDQEKNQAHRADKPKKDVIIKSIELKKYKDVR